MTDTKTCTNESCKAVFERTSHTSYARWETLDRCPDCRKKARHPPRANEQQITTLGRYEVKSEIIDRFLYGQ